MINLEQILKAAVVGGASDIILKSGSVPRFRYNGNLVSASDGEILSSEIISKWINDIVPKHLKAKLDNLEDADFSYQSPKGYRFRVNAFKQQHNFGMTLRIVSNHIKTVEELQLPPILNSIAQAKRGLILVTGVAGVGKSTTLAAMIQKINTTKPSHIITIEDPIEYVFKDNQATINQREIGIDAMSYASALKSALRQSPDIILVGELRDKETVEIALTAAETGHLVLSTLHTGNTVESISRLLFYFPQEQHKFIRASLSQTLSAVVSQRLLPRKEGFGMVAAFEIMIPTALIREEIARESKAETLNAAIRDGKDSYGMLNFDDSLLQLVRANIISAEEATRNASNKNDFILALRGIGHRLDVA